MNAALTKVVVAGSLTGLLFGFDTAVIAGTTQGLTSTFGLDRVALGWIVSSVLWGTLAGAFFAGYAGGRFGARDSLRAIAFLYFLSACGVWVTHGLFTFVLFRALCGVAIGASSVLVPTYLAEIAPARSRGVIVGAFQLNIVIGILAAYLSNFAIELLNLGTGGWRWKFAVAVVPAILLGDLLFGIPNSPRWLAAKGRVDEAACVLAKLGVKDVQSELKVYASDGSTGVRAPRLLGSGHGRSILLVTVMGVFNQLSGINALLYYLNDFFGAAGYGRISADWRAILLGATNLIFTLIALAVIDRIGRRKLLRVGSIGLIISLAVLAYIGLTATHHELFLAAIVLFVASFAVSQGTVIWVYIPELFPSAIRAKGVALGASMHWLMDAAIIVTFPAVAAYSKALPFIVFGIAMTAQLIIVTVFFPETSRLSLEEVHRLVTQKQNTGLV